jgi:sarcosine oxidase
MRGHDVVVLGLGAMGSAAAYHLARRGARVLGIDRYAPPHTLGSTHGRTRITREAYYEHPSFVPLVRRAGACWAALEREWGAPLFARTGGLMIGPAEGALVAGALRAAREHAVPHELLDASEVRRRFPGYHPPDEQVALFEPGAGVLFPEACVEAHLGLAARQGATVWTDTVASDWRVERDGVVVDTGRGAVRASRLVLAAGPWLPALLGAHGGIALPLLVERQLSHWFQPRARPETLAPERCPLALWEHAPGDLFAAFPDFGDGVKCGGHHDGEATDPERVDRMVHARETAAARAQLERLLPDAAGALREERVCLYTNTPDASFVIDHLPDEPAVIVASACSGHGFKFSSAVGEALADLATGATPRVELGAFGIGRFR